jgi:hypothetical protein
MDELFSCRNCIHNSSQSPNIGNGSGFCLKHDSVIPDSSGTTCKYLHRKDLPRFAVDEGLREHAAEFAGFSGLVNLVSKRPIDRVPYSERYVWERGVFDPVVHALAQYYKTGPSWVFVQTFSGGIDGRRALTHGGLVRRYMDRCGTWRSSYRLVLALVHELDTEPRFDTGSLVRVQGTSDDATHEQALWDVVFTRLAALQEYGFHSGIEDLMWVTDSLNGGLSELNWRVLRDDIAKQRSQWSDRIIMHARSEHVFFPSPDEEPHEEPLV